MRTSREWIRLASFDFGYEVDFAEVTLEEAGIPVLVKGRESGIWGPGFAGRTSQGLSIWVPEDRLADARAVLSDSQAEPPQSP